MTLIELLVVISIIAILAAMLMPGIRLVKTQAQSMRCASSQRQLGMASIAYADDWHGMIPRIKTPKDGTDWTTPMHWWNSIADYLGHDRTDNASVADSAGTSVVWGCPLWRPTQTRMWTGCVGYGMNFNPLAPASERHNDFWDDRWQARDIPLTAVPDQSRRILFGDATNWFLKPSYSTFPSNPGYRDVWDQKRHGGRAVYVFFDGHVQGVAAASDAYLGCADPASPAWRP